MKKVYRNVKKAALVLAASLSAVIIAGSCEIGLGEAVDVYAPTVSVTYPPQGSVIQDEFILAGTWDDDTGVTQVVVELTRTDTDNPVKYGSFDVSIDSTNKRWQTVINPKKQDGTYTLPDGSYAAEIYGRDTAGRKSNVASNSFDIDNTAPVLTLSKPVTFGSSTETQLFGRQVRIGGDIVEKHATRKLVINIQKADSNYDPDGSAPVVLEVEDVKEMSSDSPLVIARYDGSGDALDLNYQKIYGDQSSDYADIEKNGTVDKYFRCSFKLYDDAKEYKIPFPTGDDRAANQGVPATPTETGNASTSYFVGTDELSETVTTASSKFKLNPGNNPTYTIGGFKYPSDSSNKQDNFRKITLGSQVTLQVQSGSDKGFIVPKSTYVDAIQIETAAGVPVLDNGKPKYAKDALGNVIKVHILKADEWKDTDANSVSKNLDINSDKGLKQKAFYVFDVHAVDRDGNEAIAYDNSLNEQVFAFYTDLTSNPPTLTIDNKIKDKYYSGDTIKTTGITIPFVVKTEGIKLVSEGNVIATSLPNQIKIKQKVADPSETGIEIKDTVTTNPASATPQITKPTNYTQKDDNENLHYFEDGNALKIGGTGNTDTTVPSTPGLYKYTFYLEATDSNNKTGSDLFTFYVDNKKPEITSAVIANNNYVTKTATPADTNKYLNGNISVNVTVSDNYKIKQTKYWVYAYNPAGADDAAKYHLVSSVEKDENEDFKTVKQNQNFSIDINTTDSTFDSTNKTLLIKFEVEDEVGNKETSEETIGIVDQTTDIPVISFNNFTSVADTASVTDFFTKGATLYGNVTDDDGLVSSAGSDSTLVIKNESGNIVKETDNSTTPPTEKTFSYPIVDSNKKVFKNITLPSAAGFYQIVVDVKDSKYAEADADSSAGTTKATIESYRKASKSTWVAVDNEYPTIEVSATQKNGATSETVFETTTTEKKYNNGKDLTWTINLSDDLQLAKTGTLVIKVNDTSVKTENLSEVLKTKAFAWEFKLSEDTYTEKDYKIDFIVKDFSGKETTVSRTVCKDKTPPTFTAGTVKIGSVPAANLVNGWYNITTLPIEGAVTDPSGVTKVQYTTAALSDDDSTVWKTFAGTDSFGTTVSNLTNNSTIYLRATDGAENTTPYKLSEVANVTKIGPLQIDVDKPTVSLHNEAADPENDAAVYKYTTEAKPADPNPDNRTWTDISDSNIISNGLTPIALKLDLNDATSGVKKLTVRFGADGNIVYEQTFASVPTSPYEVLIPANKLESGTLWAEVTDVADNSTNQSLNLSVTFDNTYPEAKISKIKYYGTDTELKSSKANKKITFEGTATDDQKLVSIQLRYKMSTEADTAWRDYGTTLTSDIYNWTIDVDTTTLSGYADGVIYDFRVIGTDAAGNTGNSNAHVVSGGTAAFLPANNKQITIDEASDRPTITITNIDFANTMASGFDNSYKLKKQNAVYISVEDDDGDVTKVEWTDKTTPTESDWVEIEDNYFTLADGAHTVSFRVTDAQNGSFVSGPKDDTNNVSVGPYLKSKSGNEPNSLDTRLYIIVDIKGPKVVSPTFASKKASGQTYATDDFKESQSDVMLGGDYGFLGLKFSMSDNNGVNSVQIKLGNKVIASATDSTNAQKGVSAEHEWEFKDIPLTYTDAQDATKSFAFADGANVITVIATDYMDNTDESAYTINVDKSSPEITVDSHKNGDLVGTAFTLKGYISGKDTANNRVTTVKFFVDNNATVTENAATWNTANKTEPLSLTDSNWRLVVDGIENASTSQETHTNKSHKEMFVDVYGSTEKIELNDVNTIVYKNHDTIADGTLYRTVKPLYFHFLATDAVGNKKVTNLQLQVDPQGDLPSVQITYPVNASTGIEKVNGKIFVQGKATTQGINTIEGVYLQIDPAITVNGSTYTFNSSKWEKTNLDAVKTAVGISALNSSIVNLYKDYNDAHPASTKTTNLYGIKVGTDANWSTIINSNGELNGAAGSNRQIGLRVYVVDSAGNISIANAADDVFLEIDANAPTIGENGRLYVKQYRWIDTDTTAVYYVNTHAPDTDTVLYTDPGCRTVAKDGENDKKWAETLTSSIVSKDYEDKMWLSGEWWLTGPIVDASGISSIVDSLAQTNTDEGDTTTGYVIYTAPNTYGNKKSSVKTYTADDGDAETTDPTGFWFNYRIGSNAASHGTIKYRLVARDNDTQGEGQSKTSAPLTSTKDISICYDNVAPVIKAYSDDDLARLRAVRNSNGFYQFSLEADEKGETQSGFARTVFYFERTTTGVIYDNFLKKSDSNNNVAKDSLVSFDGLFWREGTVASTSGSTVTLSAAVNNIHGGGLVKLGSEYYIVQNYNSSTITLDGTPDSSVGNGAKIYFALGNVIDNESEAEGTSKITADEGYGYFDINASGYTAHDKDYMVESAVTSNGVTECRGSINSVNIRDGGVKIHYAVFDKAGNVSTGTIENAVVENNAPRLAGLTVWCDNNADGRKDADEVKSRYSGEAERYSNSTTKMARATSVTQELIVSGDDPNNSLGILHKNADEEYDASPFMTIKGKVRFIPEIIGGNDDLYYRYMWGAPGDFADSEGKEKAYSTFGTTGTARKGESTESIGKGNENNYNRTDYYGDSYISGTTYETKPIEIAFETLSGLGNGEKWFKYEIWDSTESTTKFATGNLNTTFSVYLDLQCNDTEKPTVTINNFDFQDSTHNSVYRSDLSNGHIDFNISDEDTSLDNIKNVNVTQTSKTQTTFGSDPKVSGIITIRGTAKDNIALSELKMKFPTHTNGVTGKGIGIDLITVAQYTKGDNETTYSWKPVSSDYSNAAAKTYDSAKRNMLDNGWTFDVWDDYFNEDGHQVSWECSIDTTKVTNLAQLDVLFQVQAIAKNGTTANKTSADTKQSMDVVPYITKVTTDLSKQSSTTPTMYSRTALGHYPINGTKDETVKVYGFNLKHDEADKKDAQGNVEKDAQGKNIKVDLGYVTITPTSGAANEIATLVTTNGIPVLNNLNNNNAAGYTKASDGTKTYVTLTESNAETYGYNRQPNNKNNNRLDDDVVFDVWTFNSQAVISINGASDSVDNAAMKIDPVNHHIGFAFSNGSERFSMPGKIGSTTYSYYPFDMTYDYMKHNALHYDSFGNAYGCTVGGDIAANATADMFSVMTNGRGPAPSDYVTLKYDSNYSYAGHHMRVETIGLSKYTGITKVTDKNEYSVNYSYTKNKDRFQSQSFATYSFTENEINYSHVYLAYYDLLRKQVKVKSGLYNNTDNTFSTIKTGTTNQFDNHFGGSSNEDLMYCQVIAGTVETGVNSDGTIKGTTETLGTAGKYVAIGVAKPEAAIGTSGEDGYVAAKTETVVLVWYDGQNLKYTYKTDAANGKTTQTGNDVYKRDWGKEIEATGTATYYDVSDWAEAKTLLPNSGQYCQLYVDPNNGIHVAAYSNSGKLEYAYLPKYDQFANKKTVIVDGFNDVGSYLTLDVAGETRTVNGTSKTYYVPHFGYAGAFPEKPRYAYMAKPEVFFENTDTNTISGLVDKKYTQVFECSIVPTASSVVKQRQMNVGVWKNSSGMLNYSTTNGNAPSGTTNIGTNRSGSNDGLVWGNGTKNAVLGYVISGGGSSKTIETAQKK